MLPWREVPPLDEQPEMPAHTAHHAAFNRQYPLPSSQVSQADVIITSAPEIAEKSPGGAPETFSPASPRFHDG